MSNKKIVIDDLIDQYVRKPCLSGRHLHDRIKDAIKAGIEEALDQAADKIPSKYHSDKVLSIKKNIQ